MSSITVGSVVELITGSVSLKNGVEQHLARGTKGRVCKVMDFYCCVQFAGSGCRRISKHRLRPTTGAAPPCSFGCSQSC